MPLMTIGGLAALALGAIMFFAWLEAVLVVVKALIPLGLLMAGAAAVYLGWEEFRDFKKPRLGFSSPDEASRYRAEAAAYQSELKDIRESKEKIEPDGGRG